MIDEEGTARGIMSPREALKIAKDKGLDLVEVAANAKPPVCKIMDYGKWKYEKAKKQDSSKSSSSTIREVKLRPKIGEHDYQVKSRTVNRLLDDGDKVKVTMRFRGREAAHLDRARDVLMRLVDDSDGRAKITSEPSKQGRTMIMVLQPVSQGGGS